MKKLLIFSAACLATFLVPVAQANDSPALTEAREVAKKLPPKLMVALQAAMAKSGPEGAIPVCKEMAPQMAADISKESGWVVKRVSLKARNESQATPDAWEKAALEDFDKRAAAGESAAQLEKGEVVGQEFRYVKALPTQTACLACHGSQDQLTAGVKAALKQLYPNDLATGYTVGQLRGAMSVRKAN